MLHLGISQMKICFTIVFVICSLFSLSQTDLNKLSVETCSCFSDNSTTSDKRINKCISKVLYEISELELNSRIEFFKILGANCTDFLRYTLTKSLDEDKMSDKEFTETIAALLEFFRFPSESGRLPNSADISITEVGLKYNTYLNQTRTDSVYKSGFHLLQPEDSMMIFDITEKPIYESLDALSKEGEVVTLNLRLRHSPKPDSIGVIVRSFRTEFNNQFIIPNLRAESRKIISKFSSSELYRSYKEELANSITQSLKQVIGDWFYVRDLKIEKIEYPHLIQRAKNEGLLDYYNLLNNPDKTQRLNGLKSLFDNSSKTAYWLILTHWSNEPEQEVLDYIIDELSKK